VSRNRLGRRIRKARGGKPSLCIPRLNFVRSSRKCAAALAFVNMHGDVADKALARVIALGLEENFETVESEVNELLPVLIEAGYVETYGHSPTGFLWRYSRAGVKRGDELRAWDEM
jgi:hypothetical protein